MDGQRRIELTVRLWRGGSKRQFERYINRLLKLLPRHGGQAERRAGEVGGGPGRPDAVLVLSFPDGDAIEAYLTDPRRDDLEELAAHAVMRVAHHQQPTPRRAGARPRRCDQPPAAVRRCLMWAGRS